MDLESTLEGHMDRVWCVSWSPNQLMLATSSSDKKIKIWGKDLATNAWSCLCTMDEGHTKTIRHLAWSPQGNLLASASFDGTTCIWARQVTDQNLDFVCI